jgi:hypothetical protein
MKTKDFLYIGIIAILVIKILVSSTPIQKPPSFKIPADSLKLYKSEIELLKKAYDLNRITIDSLSKQREKIQTKYKTKYEAYLIKDSLANSLSIDAIQKLWAKRYDSSSVQR